MIFVTDGESPIIIYLLPSVKRAVWYRTTYARLVPRCCAKCMMRRAGCGVGPTRQSLMEEVFGWEPAAPRLTTTLRRGNGTARQQNELGGGCCAIPAQAGRKYEEAVKTFEP